MNRTTDDSDRHGAMHAVLQADMLIEGTLYSIFTELIHTVTQGRRSRVLREKGGRESQ